MRPRSALVASAPVGAVCVAWLRMEEPVLAREAVLLAALALVPALFAHPWLRAGAAAGVALAALHLAYDVSPLAWLPGREEAWLSPLRTTTERGFYDFFEVPLPFDPRERPEMHALVLVAIAGFGLAIALLAAARRVSLAALVLVVGAGWPATSVPDRADLAVGALLLGSVLWLFVLDRASSARQTLPGLVAAGALVALSVVAATSGAVAREEALDWRTWDLVDPPGRRVGVNYVWNANYEGIEWPERRTTVLRIRAPRRALYWRASTLDSFDGYRWFESLLGVTPFYRRGLLPRDLLLPETATDPTGWVRQDVEVVGLRDQHVVAAAQPVRLEGRSLDRRLSVSSGAIWGQRTLPKGLRYTVWSYAPRPAPRDLVRSLPAYPHTLGRYLDLVRYRLPAFGEPGRTREVTRLVASPEHSDLRAYAPVWEAARRLLRPGDSPYETVLAVERWLRSGGGFRYSERPPRPVGAPPLVDFVTRSREGYCQHFAGVMTVMLRLLGIPSRVAVGFTSGSWNDGEWIVTDRDAHAWVEVWLDGFGWLTFDPTPGRGSLSAVYTLASDSADAVRALGTGRLLDLSGESVGSGRTGGGSASSTGDDGSRGMWAAIAAAAAAGLVGALGGLKLLRARLRYRTRDPRRIASATRAELLDFLRDQRVPVPAGASPAQLALVLESRLGVSGRAWRGAAERARYGSPARAVAAAEQARHEVRAALRAAREGLAPRRRLRGFLSLRSLRP